MHDRDSDEFHGAEGGENGPSLFLILTLVVAAIALIFVFQNGDRATINFLFFDSDVRIWFALAIAFVLGAVVDRLVQIWWRRSRRDRD